MVHAENSHETRVLHSPLCAKSVKPKPRLVPEDPNEIFPIPDDISWREISKNLDFHRQSIGKQKFSNASKDDQVIMITSIIIINEISKVPTKIPSVLFIFKE